MNSLSPNLNLGVDWSRLETSAAFSPLGQVSCCMLDSNDSKMVFCRGLVSCIHSAPGTRLAQLPSNMYPRKSLTFAVLCDGPAPAGRSLGKIRLDRDGWLRVESITAGCLVDLGGVHFALCGGLPLAEGVQIFCCTVKGQSLAMLQGKVSEKVFDLQPKDQPLLVIPPDFRPAEVCPFVVPGSRSAGFHLLQVSASPAGGRLDWRDSVWNRDEMELTAVVYKMPINLECLPCALIGTWSNARRNIVLEDFRQALMSRFGSLDEAWQAAFDVWGDGDVDFAQFAEGCRLAQFSGNVCRLWSMLDLAKQGLVTLQDLCMSTLETGLDNTDSLNIPGSCG